MHKEHPGKAEAEVPATKTKVGSSGAALPVAFYKQDKLNGAQPGKPDS